jgi:multidrug efflux pump subunit AcrA (membrane-fusion protein)
MWFVSFRTINGALADKEGTMRRGWWIILAVVIVTAAGAYWWFTRPAPAPVPARSAFVVRQDVVNTVSASGTIAPETQWLVTFEAPGTIVEVNVAAGDYVTAGRCWRRSTPSIWSAPSPRPSRR